MLDFETWLEELAIALGELLQCDGAEYIRQTGKECWRDAYEDGLLHDLLLKRRHIVHDFYWWNLIVVSFCVMLVIAELQYRQVIEILWMSSKETSKSSIIR